MKDLKLTVKDLKLTNTGPPFTGGLIDPDAWIKKKFEELENRIKTLEEQYNGLVDSTPSA